MSLKGNLQSVDLGNVLQMLSQNQKEGTLVLFDGETRKSIYFSNEGVSMLARGRRGTDTLGRILLRHGKVTPEALESALSRQATEGRLLGEILREDGAVAAEDVEQAVRTQIEEEIHNLFVWKEASFEFIEGPPLPEGAGPTRVTFDLDSLVQEARRKASEWERIRSWVPSLDEIYRPTETFDGADRSDPVFQAPFAGRVLELLREGRRNVSEILDASHGTRFDVCRILALLQEQGAIEPVSMAELQQMATEASGRGAHDQAAKFLLRIADLGGATPAVNMTLGYALEAMDEPERASVHLRNAAEAYVEMVEPKHAFEAYARVARSLPTDLHAVTQVVEIASNHLDILEAHRDEILEMGRTLARCLREIGRLPPALQILHNLAQNAPEDLALREMLVQVYVDSGMTTEAVAELESMAASCEAREAFDEAIRHLRKAVMLDRTREGLLKKIEALGRHRDRTKRLFVRIGIAGAVIAAAGTAWFALHLTAERRKRNEEAAQRIVADALSPVTGRFDAADAKAREATRILKSPGEVPDAAMRDAIHALRDAVAAMEREAGEFEAKCGDLFAKHGEFLQPDFRATRPRPLREKANEARRQQNLLFERIAGEARELARAKRKEAENWPSRALPGVERSVLLLAALEVPTAFEDEGRTFDVERLRETLRRYGEQLASVQEKADRLAESGNFPGARDLLAGFLGTYFTVTEFAETLRFPARVTTTPPGATVRVLEGIDPGRSGTAPLDVAYTAAGGLRIEVAAEGFETRTVEVRPPRAPFDPESLRRDLPATLVVTLDKVPVWSAALDPGGVDAPPAGVPGGRWVVALDRGGRIHLIETETGKRTLHDARTLGGFQGSPVVTEDTIYAASLDGVIVAVAVPGLEERWRVAARDGPGRVYGAPVLAGDLLVAAGEGGTVMAWEARTGRPRWTATLRRGTRMPLVFTGQWIVAHCEDGLLRILDLEGQGGIEVLPEGERRSAYPPPGADPLVVGDKILLGEEGKGNGFALVELPPPGAASPHVGFRWGVSEEAASAQGAALEGNDLFLLFNDGRIRRISSRQVPKPGESALPGLEEEEVPVGRPAVADGMVFVAHRGGLAAFSLATLRWEAHWRWAVPGENTITTSPVIVGRTVVVGSRNGTVYALLRK